MLHTLVEGIILVILVILLFLRDWRSTIVAMVAIPVSVDRRLHGDVVSSAPPSTC